MFYLKMHMNFVCVCTCICVHSLHGQNKEFSSVQFSSVCVRAYVRMCVHVCMRVRVRVYMCVFVICKVIRIGLSKVQNLQIKLK